MSDFLGKPLRFLAVLCSLVAAASSQTVRWPGTTPVTSAAGASQDVQVVLPHGGTVTSVRVLTGGIPKLDFQSAANTCMSAGTFLPGQTCTVSTTFQPTAPGERRGAIVLLDAANHTLATQLLVGSATGAVGTFVPGTIATIAGNEAWIYGGDGNLATQSSIFLPFGMALDAAGNLFIADSSNNRIRRVDAVSGIISTVAGTGVIGATGDGGSAILAALSSPTSIALDPAGNLFFSDSGNNSIRRIDAITGIISTVAGTPNAHGNTGDNGPATAATLNTPNGIAIDSLGTLYIADTGNHSIRAVSLAGTITTVAGRGFAAFSGDGGPAVSAGLNSPWSVTPSPAGELYIADQNNNRIRKVDIAGNIATIIGDGSASYSGDNGPAAAAELNVPASVALDVAGNLYIADSGNNRIRKINAKTGIITTIAGNSGESISGDEGPADQAGLYGPYTLVLDSQGSLLIADVFHNRIRKVSANSGTLVYPPMRVGRISSPIQQMFENDGNAPLTPGKLDPANQSQLDASATTCSSTKPLAPMDTCVVSLQFAPTITGKLVQGLFNLNSDAANSPGALILEGQVLSVDPATVTLTSTPNPSATGAAVTFSVTVASDGATPTGQVVLLDGTNTLATAQLQAGGLATFSISTLTGGQHTITCSYAGDTSNSAAVSLPLLQVVKDQQAPTTTLLASSASPIDAGATLRLTASVAATAAGSGVGALTGTVAFKEGLNTLGTADINNGQATISFATLAPGTHTILAVYNGSSTYGSSTSAALTQIVQIASTRLALTSSANPANAGAPLTLSATILGSGGTPTGLILFADAGKPLGSAPLNGQGMATLTVPGATWLPGTHTLTATYAGDAFDAPSVSQPLSEIINLAAAHAVLATSVNPSPLSGALTLTATLTSNGSVPTGLAHFLDGSNEVGTATISPAGLATFSSSTLALGDHTLTVTYPGDTYNHPATSAPVTETIIQTTVAVTLASSANPAIFAAPVTFSVQVTVSGAAPTGTVTLNEGSVTLASTNISTAGLATFSLANLPIGPHTLTALYSGDTSHAGTSSAALLEHILQATTLTLAASPNHAIAGTPVTFSFQLTGTSGKPATGPVTLNEGTSILATLTPDTNGLASSTLANLPVGTHTLIATYPGDTLNAQATSSPAVVLVAIAQTTTTLTASTNPAIAGSPITFTAVVTGNGATPGGSVVFHDGPAILGSAPLTGGSAQLNLATLAPGLHPITAVYGGDPFDAPSTSPLLTEQVARHTTIAITSSANPSLLTDAITFTLTTGNGTPATPPTGALILTDGASTIATLPLTNGIATFAMASPALGGHTLVATYAGDNENTPATSQPFLQTVNLRPSTISFTPSSTALSDGQQLILISVVQAVGPTPATGSVTFVSGSTVLGTTPIAAGGIATLTLTPAQATYNIVARYSGDSLYAPSTSTAVAVIVGPPVEFNMTLSPPTMTLQSGQHGTVTIALTTAPTFADTLSFGCAGLPASATCTFSQDQMVAGGGLPHTLTVVIDTGNPLGAGAQAALTPGLHPTRTSTPLLCALPALFLLGFVGKSARRKRLGKLLLLALSALAILPTLTGCGSSFTQHATPVGTYTFQIVATGAKTAATNAAPVLLKVTQ